MKHWRSGLTLSLGLISVAPLLHAAFTSTYTASPTAPVPTSCFPGPGDLQSCLDIAANDPQSNIVLLQPGTYSDGPYIYQPVVDSGVLTIMNEQATLPVLDGGNSDYCLGISTGSMPSDAGADINISGLTFQNCNGSGSGGALSIFANEASITLENSSFFDNQTTDDDGGAASLSTDSGNITVRESLFERNYCSNNAGALLVRTSFGEIDIQNSTFNDNTADNFGGGAYISVDENGNVNLLGNTFAGNDAGIAENGSGGGARIFGGDGNVLVSGNLFVGNNSGSDGGGLEAFNYFDGPGSISLVNNIIAGNSNGNNTSSSNTYGGGVFISNVGAGLSIINNTITGNTSQASDDAANGGGVALLIGNAATAEIYNNIIFGNTAEANGGDIYSDEDTILAGGNGGATLNLFNNDFSSFYSEALDNGGGGTVNQGNNIDADPLFVNALGGDFNLSANSPAIDTGDPSAPGMPATDFNGNPRPSVAGTNPDMGAIEVQPEPSASPTPTPAPIPPVLLQGTGCSLQTTTLLPGSSLVWSWLLALGAMAIRRKSK